MSRDIGSIDFAANPGKDEQDIFFDKLRTFVVTHESTLSELQRGLEDRWDATTWDLFSDTATVDLSLSGLRTTVADTLGPHYLHNKLFFRVSLSLSTAVLEMKSLTEECFDTLIPPLVMYGDPEVGTDVITDECAQQGLGRIIPLLMDTWNWIERAKKIIAMVVRLLAGIHTEPTSAADKYAPYQKVHFPLVWHALMDLVGAVVTLEEIFYFHDTMRQGFVVYRRMLQNVAKTPDKFNADEFAVEQFGKLLYKLEKDLTEDNILMSCVCQKFDMPEIAVTTNAVFFNEFNSVMEQTAGQLFNHLSSSRGGEAPKKLIGLYGLYILHFYLFKEKLKVDTTLHKRLTKEIFDLHTKQCVVFCGGTTVFKPAQWLYRRLPSALSTCVKDPVKEGMVTIKAECGRVAASLQANINYYTTCITIWCAQMQSSFPSTRATAKQHIRTITALIARGIMFAQEISRLIRNVVFLHQSADLELSLSMVDGVAHCVELLMMIRATFHSRTSILTSMHSIICQSQVYIMQKNLYPLHTRISEAMQTARSEEITDQHSAIGEIMALLSAPLTPQALVVMDVVMSIAFGRNDCHFQPKETEEIRGTFMTLQKLALFQKHLAAATDCDFLYWQRVSFYPVFFRRLYNRNVNTEYFRYLIFAMHDCCGAILSAKHVEHSHDLLHAYSGFIKHCLHEEILQPLFSAVETDLRLHTHSAVLGQPYKLIGKDVKDLARFTRMPPFRLLGESIHIAALVEDYLDTQFYNLNALHPNDWKTYEEMRTLANERYGIKLVEGFLPGSIVDQGLDVLVVTKNIQVFVANYTYNLNENFFIQRPAVTESKNLHTLQIRHITNSIRTHGTGIMNTTVNYVYKCILKKLAIVSQFLYDDHVRSRLLKDIKYYTAHRDERGGLYPIARAEKFCSEIRKLGVTDDNKTYLDQFRLLVSEIGNALGYMRMVRAGGLRFVADAATFIPELENVKKLEKSVNPALAHEGEENLDEMLEEEKEEEEEEQQVHESTVQSVHLVDDVSENLLKRLSQGSDYFRILEEAIAQRIMDESKYGHLRNFFMIVPPLSISFVEFMVQQKELLVKKNKEGLFTDDGFALGCVFLLSLFRCHEQYDSLHWFDSVKRHYSAKKREMEEGMAKRRDASKSSPTTPNYSQDDIKTMQLTLTMAEAYLQEYSLVHDAFTACKVFFKYHVVEKGEEEGEDEEKQEAPDDAVGEE